MSKRSEPVLLVGAAHSCPDLVYATGFAAHDPVVYLATRKGKFLVVPALEIGRARRAVENHPGASKCHVLSPDNLTRKPRGGTGPAAWSLGIVRREKVHHIRVPSEFPMGVAKRLMRSGIKIQVTEGELFAERAVKQPWEIRSITESQQAAVLAIRGAVAMISAARADKKGVLKLNGSTVTSERVRQSIMKTLLEHGCSCPDVIVAGGKLSADPHEKGSGPLRAGEPIVMDIFPRHGEHLYWGDITRTVVKGDAGKRVRNMYRAVRAAQRAALAKIRPGVKCATVHGAARDEIERRGFHRTVVEGKPAGFIHSTGHGVGLCVHEAPGLGGGDARLRSGHVVTVEPGLYYGDIGGVRIEDTVVVTATGWRYLVPCEKRLEV